jgi:hypothetical protein
VNTFIGRNRLSCGATQTTINAFSTFGDSWTGTDDLSEWWLGRTTFTAWQGGMWVHFNLKLLVSVVPSLPPFQSNMMRHKNTQTSLTDHSRNVARWQMKFNVFSPINHYHFIESIKLMSLHSHLKLFLSSHLNTDPIKSLTVMCRWKDSKSDTKGLLHDVSLKRLWCQTKVNISEKFEKWQKHVTHFKSSQKIIPALAMLINYVRITELHNFSIKHTM